MTRRRMFDRLRWPPTRERRGSFVGLIGPDGSGKSTLADELTRQLRSRGRRCHYIHWRPPIVRRLESAVPDGPPVPKVQAPAHVTIVNRGTSTLRLARSMLVFDVSYLLRLRAELRRGTVIIADRWIYNYVLQPASVRYFGSRRLAAFVCTRLVVRPHFLFALEADAETIAARKNELTVAEIEDELDRVDLHARAWRICRLDARRSPAELAGDVMRRLTTSEIAAAQSV